MSGFHLSILIPLHNEEEVFSALQKRLDDLVEKIGSKCEIILIDDGSSDSTRVLINNLALSDPKYQAIILSRNFGQQKAYSAAMDVARGEYIMFLDADLQDPPELYFDFMEKIEEGYDVVYGIRKKRKENRLKKSLYYVFYRLLSKLSNYPIPKDSGDFALITKRVGQAMNSYREDSIFLRGIRSWVGFKQVGIPYHRDERFAGKPKYTFNKLFNLGFDGIFNFSSFPIRISSLLGFLCIISSIVYFLITLFRKYMYDDVPSGFTALLFVIILFGGMQFLFLGILGEYIQRIFFQVKNRPLYLIDSLIIDGKKE